MFKKIGQVIKKALATAIALMQRGVRPMIKVKLTRHYLCLWLPRCFGGEFHLLPRKELTGPWHFSVAAESQRFILQMINAAGSKVKLAHFPNEVTAYLALAKLRRALIGKCMTKWLWRLSMLCLIYLIGWWLGHSNSPIQASSSKALLTERPLNAAVPTTEFQLPTLDTNNSKSVPQADELSNHLSQQIIEAQANAKYVRLDSARQYELEPHALVPNSDASALSQSSIGCNPKFAFDVAQP